MYSVRRRLMIVLAVGFTVVIAGVGIYLCSVLRSQVTEQFDLTLLAKANALAALTEQEGGQIELDYTPTHMPEYEREERPEHFEFWLDDGAVLYRSRRLGTTDLRDEAVWGRNAEIIDVELPDGRAGRMVTICFFPRGPGVPDDPPDPTDPEVIGTASKTRGLILSVARGRERLDGLIGRIRFAVFGLGAAAALLAVLLAWRALVAGFRPVDAIAAQVEALDADNLSARVGLERTPRELASVIEQLNGLLTRLDESFARERRFTGNVAHELRTPIAELRSLAAVGAAWPDDPQSTVRFFEDVNQIGGRMERVITDLLLLARCEAGVEQVGSVPTSLREVVDSIWSPLEPRATVKQLRFRADIPDDLVLDTDPGKLAIVISNLLGNAASYARPGSEVRCVVVRAGSTFRLEISNVAEPLTDEDLRNLTQPFWRKDEARSSGDHVGLGLALVSALANLLNLDVGFSQGVDGTFTACIVGVAVESPRKAAVTS